MSFAASTKRGCCSRRLEYCEVSCVSGVSGVSSVSEKFESGRLTVSGVSGVSLCRVCHCVGCVTVSGVSEKLTLLANESASRIGPVTGRPQGIAYSHQLKKSCVVFHRRRTPLRALLVPARRGDPSPHHRIDTRLPTPPAASWSRSWLISAVLAAHVPVQSARRTASPTTPTLLPA
jgi:hypothetical protein